jgi:hypothetical protein
MKIQLERPKNKWKDNITLVSTEILNFVHRLAL